MRPCMRATHTHRGERGLWCGAPTTWWSWSRTRALYCGSAARHSHQTRRSVWFDVQTRCIRVDGLLDLGRWTLIWHKEEGVGERTLARREGAAIHDTTTPPATSIHLVAHERGRVVLEDGRILDTWFDPPQHPCSLLDACNSQQEERPLRRLRLPPLPFLLRLFESVAAALRAEVDEIACWWSIGDGCRGCVTGQA